MPEGPELFSNPYAPAASTMQMDSMEDEGPALTNDDFRKLLMTPRVGAPNVAPPSAITSKAKSQVKQYNEEENPAALRRKKKSHYAKLKKLEEEREKELAEKYRDRARERRDGFNPDYQGTDINLKASGDYKSVGPTVEATNTAAEMRRRAIQESKFLGGDMEHTHLVKGLDFALLQKVRSEITAQDITDEDPAKRGKHKPKSDKAKEGEEDDDDEEYDEDDDMEFSTLIGQRIYRAVFKSRPPDRNELFQPGRTAYVFELEDEYAESDIPTTLIRSKADCPGMETQTTLTTNDIVINKLTQILSYLRQGMRGKKLKKKEKGKNKAFDDAQRQRGKLPNMESIYDDVGDYNPNPSSRESYDKKSKGHDHKKAKNDYFEKKSSQKDKDESRKPEISAKDFAKSVTKQFSDKVAPEQKDKRKSGKNEKSKEEYDAHYMECYPGGMDADYNYESEEEVDYSKMDMGNKKGPIKRWDFETEEEYNAYMERREALPKAAFQFGIKMNEGRKTRRTGPKDEKAKLDRDWNKISQIISKRKSDGGSGDHGRSREKHESKSKRSKAY